MTFWREFSMRSRDPGDILREIRAMAEDLGQVQLMEICGTHTMAIARAGLKSLLPQNIRLISGPGCPVCVTPAGAVDELLRISGIPGAIIASYGDLLRVPGSRRGDSLLRRRAQGADVRMVYSPMDALAMAEANPGRQVVFAGVGFETTAPGTAACLMEARERQIDNFSVLKPFKDHGAGHSGAGGGTRRGIGGGGRAAGRGGRCLQNGRRKSKRWQRWHPDVRQDRRLSVSGPRGGDYRLGGVSVPSQGVRASRRGGAGSSRRICWLRCIFW